MLPTIFKRTFKSTFLTALLFSVSIELLQLITARGLCEFDDVFNNTLGAVIGYLLYKIIERIMYGKNFSMQDKKEVYAALKSRLKKAIKNEFWFEACMIEYALIEDRSSSILYHAGIFGIEAYSEKKSSPINFVPLIIRLERNIRLFLKKFRKSLLQIFLCGKNSEMLLYIVLVSENMMKKK